MSSADFEALQDIMTQMILPLLRQRLLKSADRLVDQLITYYQLHVESLREVQSIKILRELL
jgi:hypothetical protein